MQELSHRLSSYVVLWAIPLCSFSLHAHSTGAHWHTNEDPTDRAPQRDRRRHHGRALAGDVRNVCLYCLFHAARCNEEGPSGAVPALAWPDSSLAVCGCGAGHVLCLFPLCRGRESCSGWPAAILGQPRAVQSVCSFFFFTNTTRTPLNNTRGRSRPAEAAPSRLVRAGCCRGRGKGDLSLVSCSGEGASASPLRSARDAHPGPSDCARGSLPSSPPSEGSWLFPRHSVFWVFMISAIRTEWWTG